MTGKALAAGIRAVVQAFVVVVVAALLGVSMTWNPLKLLAVAAVVVLGGAAVAGILAVSALLGRLSR